MTRCIIPSFIVITYVIWNHISLLTFGLSNPIMHEDTNEGSYYNNTWSSDNNNVENNSVSSTNRRRLSIQTSTNLTEAKLKAKIPSGIIRILKEDTQDDLLPIQTATHLTEAKLKAKFPNGIIRILKEDIEDGVRINVGYINDIGHDLIIKVAKRVYHDLKRSKFVSIQIDEDGLQILVDHNDIITIESDSIWKENGIIEQMNITTNDIYSIDFQTKYGRYIKTTIPVTKNNDTHIHHNLRSRNQRRTNSWYEDTEHIPYGVSITQADQIDYGTKERVVVCLVDTGVTFGHPDLHRNGKMRGKNREGNINEEMLWWKYDKRGHGTHIAGIVSAKANNQYGIRGMGNIPLFITRGLDDDGNARESDICEAIEQCEDAGAKVISMSLSGSSMGTSMKALIDRIYMNKNILLVAAAGNDGTYSELYPASYNKVLGVNAIDESETLWPKSNYGPSIELTAPGYMILSTSLYVNNEYTFAFYSGTSMAVPHVAGAVAILVSHYPTCTMTQIRYALAYTAKNLGQGGQCNDHYGYGLFQVKDAYDFLSTHSCNNAEWGLDHGDGHCSIIDIDVNNIPSSSSSSSVTTKNKNNNNNNDYIVYDAPKRPNNNNNNNNHMTPDEYYETHNIDDRIYDFDVEDVQATETAFGLQSVSSHDTVPP